MGDVAYFSVRPCVPALAHWGHLRFRVRRLTTITVIGYCVVPVLVLVTAILGA